MTLIAGSADDWVCAITRAGLTGIGLRAHVAVIARSAVTFSRITACTRRRIAGTCVMTLIDRSAHNRITTGTYPCLTRVTLSTCVAVVTRGAIRRSRMYTRSGVRVAGVSRACIAVVTIRAVAQCVQCLDFSARQRVVEKAEIVDAAGQAEEGALLLAADGELCRICHATQRH